MCATIVGHRLSDSCGVDCDSTSSIGFDEFVRVTCTYSMFTKEEILRCKCHAKHGFKLRNVTARRISVCFRSFDKDDSGSIDEKEYMALARTVNNAAPMFPANFQVALQQFDVYVHTIANAIHRTEHNRSPTGTRTV